MEKNILKLEYEQGKELGSRAPAANIHKDLDAIPSKDRKMERGREIRKGEEEKGQNKGGSGKSCLPKDLSSTPSTYTGLLKATWQSHSKG